MTAWEVPTGIALHPVVGHNARQMFTHWPTARS
jgi:hypothetical protein